MTVPMQGTHKLHLALGLLGAIGAAGAIACAMAACSSNSTNSTGNTGDSGAGTCANPNALTIAFSPMYSAYEPTHTYQLPVIVNTIGATLTASDPTAVAIQPNPDLTINGYTGWTLQMQSAPSGPVTLTAQAGSYCGSAQLSITAATSDDWQIGNARYNNGASLRIPMFGRGDGGRPPMMMMGMDAGSFFETADGGPACTSCHGETATSGILNDVAHTPEQTGGFSDDDLVNIVVNGVVPDGGYFDMSILPMAMWHTFHRWSDIMPDQYKGMVVYLRSLTPMAQMGSFNIRGFGPRDGGGG
jgi:hypothetical protein